MAVVETHCGGVLNETLHLKCLILLWQFENLFEIPWQASLNTK